MRVFAIGDSSRSEFRRVLDSLRRLTDLQLLEELSDVPDADVDLIIFLQSYTKQFSATAVDQLRRRQPLTPMVVVLGAWCAGELRTGTPLIGPFRVFAEEWDEHELILFRDAGSSLWTQPSTLGEDETLLLLADRR